MAGKKNYNKISTEAKTLNEEVSEDIVRTETEEEAPEPAAEPVLAEAAIVCNCNKLNVRKKADIESKSIKILDEGDEVGIIGRKDKTFYEVVTADGTKGFCMKKYIKIN